MLVDANVLLYAVDEWLRLRPDDLTLTTPVAGSAG